MALINFSFILLLALFDYSSPNNYAMLIWTTQIECNIVA